MQASLWSFWKHSETSGSRQIECGGIPSLCIRWSWLHSLNNDRGPVCMKPQHKVDWYPLLQFRFKPLELGVGKQLWLCSRAQMTRAVKKMCRVRGTQQRMFLEFPGFSFPICTMGTVKPTWAAGGRSDRHTLYYTSIVVSYYLGKTKMRHWTSATLLLCGRSPCLHVVYDRESHWHYS